MGCMRWYWSPILTPFLSRFIAYLLWVTSKWFVGIFIIWIWIWFWLFIAWVFIHACLICCLCLDVSLLFVFKILFLEGFSVLVLLLVSTWFQSLTFCRWMKGPLWVIRAPMVGLCYSIWIYFLCRWLPTSWWYSFPCIFSFHVLINAWSTPSCSICCYLFLQLGC